MQATHAISARAKIALELAARYDLLEEIVLDMGSDLGPKIRLNQEMTENQQSIDAYRRFNKTGRAKLLPPDLPKKEALKVLTEFGRELGCLFKALKFNPILFT